MNAPVRPQEPQTDAAATPELAACPCGCKQPVKPGNKYGGAGCYGRLHYGNGVKVQRDLTMHDAIVHQGLSRQHNPTRSWWADTQHDREAFRLALQDRRPHMPLSDFGRLLGVGITAPDVQIQRKRVPLPDDETGRRGPAKEG